MNGESGGGDGDEANSKSLANNACIDLTYSSGGRNSSKKNSQQSLEDISIVQSAFQNHMNYLQQSKKSKKDANNEKRNELGLHKQQKMFNLYNYKGPSLTKNANELVTMNGVGGGLTSSSNSHVLLNNPNINSGDSVENSIGDHLKKSKLINVPTQNFNNNIAPKIDTFENRNKSKKLKTNLIDRFKENTEEEKDDLSVIKIQSNLQNSNKMLYRGDRVSCVFLVDFYLVL